MTEPFRRSIASESEKQYNLYEIYRLIKKEKEKFIMDYAKESLKLHEQWKGKIEVVATVPVSTKDDLSLAYTPRRCAALSGDPEGQSTSPMS